VFCIVYNVCIELLDFLAVFALVMLVTKLVAAILVGLADMPQYYCLSPFIGMDSVKRLNIVVIHASYT
jgi:hypothetical protein